MSLSEHAESPISTVDQELSSSNAWRTAQPVATLFQFHSGLAGVHKQSAPPANGDVNCERDTDLDLLLQQDSTKLGHVEQSSASGSLHNARTAPDIIAPCPKTESMQEASTTHNGDTTTDNLDQILDELLD